METLADLIPIKFLPARVDVERRADGTLILRSPEPLRPYARCLGEAPGTRGGRSRGRKYDGKSGSDWPMLTVEPWQKEFADYNFPHAVIRKMMLENAKRVLPLEQGGEILKPYCLRPRSTAVKIQVIATAT